MLSRSLSGRLVRILLLSGLRVLLLSVDGSVNTLLLRDVVTADTGGHSVGAKTVGRAVDALVSGFPVTKLLLC